MQISTNVTIVSYYRAYIIGQLPCGSGVDFSGLGCNVGSGLGSDLGSGLGSGVDVSYEFKLALCIFYKKINKIFTCRFLCMPTKKIKK